MPLVASILNYVWVSVIPLFTRNTTSKQCTLHCIIGYVEFLILIITAIYFHLCKKSHTSNHREHDRMDVNGFMVHDFHLIMSLFS